MDGTEMRYDAFISYRHCEPDKYVALAIQKKLENYRIPSDVASKLGKKRLMRVFRDESEFAVSDDLSEAIMEALKQSEYLIIICTPRLKESEWCRKELETFLKLRDRKHILLVLAGGEPEEVFPEILLYEEVSRTDMSGNEVMIREKREPLAADCRGKTEKERKHNMELSVIRLVASILGIGFDDLVQRHRRQRIFRRNLITLAVVLIITFIAAQALYFTHRISEQNRIISEKYADIMASTSERLLADGRRMDAIYAARSVLPDKKGEDVNIHAFRALVDAEGLFTSPMQYSCSNILSIPTSIFTAEISEDASLVGLLGYNAYRYIVDTATGEMLYSYEDEISVGGIMAFDGSSGIYMRRPNGPLYYRDLKTGEETKIIDGDGSVYSIPGTTGVILLTEKGVSRYKEGALVYFVDNESLGKKKERGFFAQNLYFSSDGKHAAVHFLTLEMKDYVIQFNVESGEAEAYADVGKSIDAMAIDGETIVYTVSYDGTSEVGCYDVAKKEISLKKEIDGIGYVYACINKGNALVARDDIAVLLNVPKGTMRSFGLRSGCIRVLPYEDQLMLIDYGGDYYLCDDTDQRYCSLDDSEENVFNFFDYKNGKFFLAVNGESYITIYERIKTEYCRSYNEESSTNIPNGFADSEATEAFEKRICEKYGDMDATYIYSSGISTDKKYGYIQTWNRQVKIYDLADAELKQTLYDCDSYIYGMYYEEETGLYYITSFTTFVCDSEMRHVMTLHDATVVATIDGTGELLIEDVDGNNFILKRVSYEDVIKEADRRLDAYEPDEAAREKYGF
ncbi:MAG: TIR domain-containing protein [Lachnospiraceae bacterium]|nr:TIR domain-containing protein [Lachnospiraceae bacterium]